MKIKTCKVIFRDEMINQDIVVDCQLDEAGDLSFKVLFDPPVTETTDLGSLSGQLAQEFCKFLTGDA